MSRFCLILFAALALPAVASPLSDHPSPYLAMHADDPVAWRLWDESLLTQAQREDRLLYISSGYFACHWCHVMQRESFRDKAIARRLNRDFIPVKIDRELWPELDAYLIDFVRQTRGSAGWPLNVFLTPEGHPLVGTGYQAPESFAGFLGRLQRRWQKHGEKMALLARRAAGQGSGYEGEGLAADELAPRLREALLAAWEREADMLQGGFGQQTKFPRVPLLEALLEASAPGSEVEAFVRLTLEQMAAGGLRDQLGGGFFRYTVDPGWQEPHFEKMLIDNAQLARFYLLAGRHLDEPAFTRTGRETLDFMLSKMRHPEGGFVSALSAVDGEEVDGGYYLWSERQLREAVGEKRLPALIEAWGMDTPSPWTAGFLPRQAGLNESLRAILLQARHKRSLPRDTKRPATWNAAALAALSLVAEVPHFRRAGTEVRDYLHGLWDGEQLWRMRDEEGARVRRGGLADYAAVALGLVRWWEATGDEESRRLATRLMQAARQRFYSQAGWRLAPLIPPKRLPRDGVSPSPVARLLEVRRLLGAEGSGIRLPASPLLKHPFDYASYLRPLEASSAPAPLPPEG